MFPGRLGGTVVTTRIQPLARPLPRKEYRLLGSMQRSSEPGAALGGSEAAAKSHSDNGGSSSRQVSSVSGPASWLGRAREVARSFREAPEVDFTWALVAFVALLADPGLGWDDGHLSVGAVVLAAATSLPLVVRRRYPLGALVLVTAGLLACLAVFHPNIAAG